MNALLLPSLLLVCAADDKPPAPKFPVGKDTTFVTGPIDKNGYVNYEAALNDILGKGVTPDNNANVLLWKAFGPKPEGGDGMPAEYFKRLGIEEPPPDGDYFIDLGRYLKEVLQVNQEDVQTVYDQQGRATQRPWTAKDYPDIAAWLKANEKPLAVVVEAVKRPKYFNPLVSRRGADDPSSLIGCLIPSVQKCREFVAALTARAMLRLAEGKEAEAWDDLLAAHRLARHLSSGGTLIETLVAYAIHAVACNSTLAYVERAGLTADRYLGRLKELRDLPPMAPLADKIGTGERLMGLDAIQMIRSGRGDKGLAPEEQKALAMIDWNLILRSCNKWYDRMSAAMRIKDRAEREKEFDVIEKELEETVKKNRDPDIKKLIKQVGAGKVVAQKIGDVLMGLLAPAVRKVQYAEDRTEQITRNLHVAFALAAYRKAEGRYPAKLADLAPKYLAAVPGDVFTGKELIYKPSANGYLFYSIGANGKDDGGQWYGDDPPGDDPRVRMPLPELKKDR
jgi:hypothetical protein